ncbi:MAG: ABC transporter substrate-binding protein [Chloroflexi bacterium]|nr:ABC transporter substrate-binding protein [Chloroflexota bacterium]
MRPVEFEPSTGARAARGRLWPLALPFLVLASLFAFGVGRAEAADCQFVLGFAALQSAAPDTVGECLENELHHPADGITRQQTTEGVLLWRKADNHTSFTDGHRTWVAGPQGLKQRPVGDRFAWESDADRVIRVGAVVSETGRFVEEGNDVRRGYQLWANWINGEYGGLKVGDARHRVELVMYDDAGEAAATRTLAERLITEDEVDFLLGPYSSGLTQIALEVADAHGQILVTASGGAESLFTQGFGSFFAVQTPAAQYTRSALQLLAGEGAASVVIAHPDTVFANSVADGARRWAAESGLNVLAVHEYPQGSAELATIIAAAKRLDPDVFVGGGHFNDAILFLQAARELDFRPAAMVITVGPSNPLLVETLGADAEYVIGPTQWEASMGYAGDLIGSAADYAARYRALWGHDPTYQAAGASAAALALHHAIEAAGTTDSASVHRALRELEVDTFFGPISFDEQGSNSERAMSLVQIQGGQILVVAPSAAAAAAIVYPAPRGVRDTA